MLSKSIWGLGFFYTRMQKRPSALFTEEVCLQWNTRNGRGIFPLLPLPETKSSDLLTHRSLGKTYFTFSLKYFASSRARDAHVCSNKNTAAKQMGQLMQGKFARGDEKRASVSVTCRSSFHFICYEYYSNIS